MSDQIIIDELSPYPASVFDESGYMCEAETKSSRIAGKDVNTVDLDGCAVLCVIQ